MLSVSEKYIEAISADSRNMPYRITLAGGETYDRSRVVKMSLEESVSGGSSVAIGTANSSTLKFTLKNAEPIDYNGMMVEAESGLELSDGTIEYVPLGKFWVTEFSTSDEYKTVNFTCADSMYLMTGEYESELTYPTTIGSVVAEIVAKSGVVFHQNSALPNITVRVKPPKMSLRDAIGHAAGCCGCNARFNRLGELEFVWYENNGTTIPPKLQYLNGLTKLNYKPLEVNFEITGKKETYKVNVVSGENGGITATPGENVYEGDTVVLAINPFSGYEVATISAVTESGENVALYKSAEGGYTFVQPDSNVTVTVSFRTNSAGPFAVTIRATDGGSAMTYKSKYDYGDDVTVFVSVSEGYEFEGFSTIPANISFTKTGTTSDGEVMYDFVMPQSDVTITANFKELPVQYPLIYKAGENEHSENGYIYMDNFTTGETDPLSAPAGSLMELAIATKAGYAFDYFDSSVELIQVSEGIYRFTMPAEEVSIIVYFKLSEDETKTGKYSWLETPQSAPTQKPYWAVFYRENFGDPVWRKFYLVWFDSWSVTGYTSSGGKRIYSVQFDGYYYCRSQNTGNAPHAWDTSTWSGNGASGSTIEWDVYAGGHAWSGSTTSGGSGEYCLLASNVHLYRNNAMVFERCEKAIQTPQTSYIVDGIDVREEGSLTYWKCPDTFSTPAPASNWMIVDAYNSLCMTPENGTYYDADYCNGFYIVFFDSISVENIGAVMSNTTEEFYIARVSNGHYCKLLAETSTETWTLYDIEEGDVLGLRSPLVSARGGGDYLGVYHFSGLIASNVDIDMLMQANSSRICDCVSEISTFSLLRRSVPNDVEQVTISYTNPFIYEKMVSDVSANVNSITYTPVNIKHRGNPAMQAGDIIIAEDKDGVEHKVLIMQQTLNFGGGMNAEISCPGQTEKTKTFSSSSPLNTQIKSEVERSSLDLERRIATNNALVYASLYKNISSTEAKIASVVEWQTENAATIAEIEQTASENEAKISLVVGQNGIVNNNGAVQGSIVIQAINGTSTAKISADRLDIEGKTLNIKVDATNIQGEITAQIVNAKKGNIGGWTIGDTYIGDTSSGGSFYIASIKDSADYWLRANVNGSMPFAVSKSGILYATGAVINGSITTTGGVIGGFDVDSNKLEKANTTTDGVLTTTARTVVEPGKIETYHYHESSDKTSTLERSACLSNGTLQISLSGSELPSGAKPIMMVSIQGTTYTILLNPSTKTLEVS